MKFEGEKNLKDIPPCHVICVCPASQRIPILDMPFIRAQRDKIGEKSGVMIVSVDKKESHKQNIEAQKKKEKEDKKQAADKAKAEKVKREEDEKRRITILTVIGILTVSRNRRRTSKVLRM